MRAGRGEYPIEKVDYDHNVPLGLLENWQDNLDAQCWLWKDHTSYREAAQISEIAAKHRPHYRRFPWGSFRMPTQ